MQSFETSFSTQQRLLDVAMCGCGEVLLCTVHVKTCGGTAILLLGGTGDASRFCVLLQTMLLWTLWGRYLGVEVYSVCRGSAFIDPARLISEVLVPICTSCNGL